MTATTKKQAAAANILKALGVRSYECRADVITKGLVENMTWEQVCYLQDAILSATITPAQ